jgi:hypothetical protein
MRFPCDEAMPIEVKMGPASWARSVRDSRPIPHHRQLNSDK